MMPPERAPRMTAVLWQWLREDVMLGLRSALLTGLAGAPARRIRDLIPEPAVSR